MSTRLGDPRRTQDPAALGRRVTVLCTSVGTECLHGFENDLRRRAPQWRIIGTDINPLAAGLYRCDAAYALPEPSDPAYLVTLLDVCERHDVDLVLPLSAADQRLFADTQTGERLGERPIVVSSAEAVRRASSKIALYESLAGIGDWLPAHRVVRSASEAIAALDELIAVHGAALLKSDTSSGDAGIICFGCPTNDSPPATGRRWLDWIAARQALYAEETSAKILPQLEALYASEADWPRLVVAYLPGSEYTVDVLADAGRPLGGAVQLRTTSPRSRAIATETVRADDVLQAAYRVTSEIGLSFVNTIRFRRDTNGQPRVLEVNPHITGTVALSVEAGLNLPLAACCLALGERMSLAKPEVGVRAMRYEGALFTRKVVSSWGRD